MVRDLNISSEVSLFARAVFQESPKKNDWNKVYFIEKGASLLIWVSQGILKIAVRQAFLIIDDKVLLILLHLEIPKYDFTCLLIWKIY